MHIHKYEKVWLYTGVGALLIFLTTLGISAFYLGNQPASCLATIDPDNVEEVAPFNEPGLKKIGEGEYTLTVVASAFNYDVGESKVIQVPKGSTVYFTATTKDVVHGFELAGTNVNMMLEPGYISTYAQKFDNTGTYTLVCNEYCGLGHHYMSATVEVVEI